MEFKGLGHTASNIFPFLAILAHAQEQKRVIVGYTTPMLNLAKVHWYMIQNYIQASSDHLKTHGAL